MPNDPYSHLVLSIEKGRSHEDRSGFYVFSSKDLLGQKALFAAHAEKVAEEIRQLQIRQRYLSGKVADFDARMKGDLELAEQIAQENQEIAKELK